MSAELPSLAEEIIAAIQREVPAYARPLAGDFGSRIRAGTEQALESFLGGDSKGSLVVYRALGRGESRAGRTLDGLQAAYRVGARVAWRKISEHAAHAGADAQLQRRLAEAMFAYIELLAAESVEGYSEAQLERAGELEARQRALFAALLTGEPDAERVRLAVGATGRRMPVSVACVAPTADSAGAFRRRLGAGTLEGQHEGETCLLVLEPLGLLERLRGAAAQLGVGAGLGPSVDPYRAAVSWRWAKLAYELPAARASVVVAEDHGTELVLLAAREVVSPLRERALRPFGEESPRSRARLERTLRSWLRHRGSQRAVAAELGIHPQTVRYRIGRVRELLGDSLEDPDRRFELELVLRAVALEDPG